METKAFWVGFYIAGALVTGSLFAQRVSQRRGQKLSHTFIAALIATFLWPLVVLDTLGVQKWSPDK